MVLDQEYFRTHRIRQVEIWCKECTRKSDHENRSPRWHNVWELNHLKDNALWVIACIIEEDKSIQIQRTWSSNAICQILRIIGLAYPDLILSPYRDI